MAYGDIQTTVSVLLAFAAAVGVVAGCVAALVKLYSWATKPQRESAHHAAEVDVRLDKDEVRMAGIEDTMASTVEVNKLQMRAMLQMMNHMIDGNHVEQLKSARDDIELFLINK